MRRLSSNDLAFGDIILSSMAVTTRETAFNWQAVKDIAGASITNTAFNLALMSIYGHAMFYLGEGESEFSAGPMAGLGYRGPRVLEYRETGIRVKPLIQALHDEFRGEPGVAHVFRHTRMGPTKREALRSAAREFLAARPKMPDPDHALGVRINGVGPATIPIDRKLLGHMVVCSSLCATIYHNAGLALSWMNPQHMTPADIALCGPPLSALDLRGLELQKIAFKLGGDAIDLTRGVVRGERHPRTLDLIGRAPVG